MRRAVFSPAALQVGAHVSSRVRTSAVSSRGASATFVGVMAPSFDRLGAGCRLVRGRVHQRHDAHTPLPWAPACTACRTTSCRRGGNWPARRSGQAGAPLRFTKVVALDRRAGTLYHSIDARTAGCWWR